MSEVFTNYFSKLFLVCAGAVICEIVCESTFENKNTVYSAVRIVCSLCVCLTVFSIFFEKDVFIDEALRLKDEIAVSRSAAQTTDSMQLLIESTSTELENKLSDIIFEKTGINPASVSIQLNIKSKDNQTQVDFKSVHIKMPETINETEIFSVKKCVYDTLGCESFIEGEVKSEE